MSPSTSAPVDIQGGTITGQLDSYSGSLTIKGGSLTGPINVYDSGVAQFSGGLSASLLSQSGYWDGTHNYANASYAVSGVLTSDDALTVTVNAGRGYSGGETLGFAGKNSVLAPDLYLTADATIADLYDRVIIGRDSAGTVNASPTVAFESGADVGSSNVYNASQLIMNGGWIHGTLAAYDDSAVTLNGGLYADLETHDRSSLTVNGGFHFGGTMNAYDASIVTINPGGALYSVIARDNSVVNIAGGSSGGATATDNGVVNFGAGSYANFVTATNGGTANISGGTVSTVNAYSGTVNISGGTIQSTLFSDGTGVINLTGGQISDRILASGPSLIHLFGSDLSVTNYSQYGYWDGVHNYANAQFGVIGFLQSGDALNTYINAAPRL